LSAHTTTAASQRRPTNQIIYANGPRTLPAYLPAPLTPASAEAMSTAADTSVRFILRASVVVVLRYFYTALAVPVRSHCDTVSAVAVHSRLP
jgi:hypothetical protein